MQSKSDKDILYSYISGRLKFPLDVYKVAEKGDFQYIYEPSHDTFLFLDCLDQEIEDIKKRQPLICLEIG
jgi:hypothetical protein